MEKEYLLEIKVKNNLLIKLMKEFDIKNQAQLAKKANLQATEVGFVANLKIPLYTKYGEVHRIYRRLADFFCVLPEELCPEHLLFEGISKNRIEHEISSQQIGRLIESQENQIKLIETENLVGVIKSFLDDVGLSPRNKDILIRRFGLFGVQDQTMAEIGASHDITRDRVLQIEIQCLKEIREYLEKHPSDLGEYFQKD